MLLVFLCAYLYYDCTSEALLVGQHLAALSALWIWTAKTANDCMLNILQKQQVNTTNKYGRKIRR